FAARLPDLQPGPLMDVDFAISCPLVRPRLPLSGFCTSGRGFATRFLQTPPRDDALAFLLILHLHQVGQGTFTPQLSIMLGTQRTRFAVAIAWCGPRRPLPSPKRLSPSQPELRGPLPADSAAQGICAFARPGKSFRIFLFLPPSTGDSHDPTAPAHAPG